jgi:Ca2+-binding EF-hand superfamily protein
MRRMLWAVLIVVAVFAWLPGSAGAQALTADWREGFRAHDRNGDGRIDRAEFHEWIVDGFFFRDKGHKGYLVQADLQGTSPERFKAMDRKGDGKLTLAECLNALFQDFAAIDVDQTGAITAEQVEAYVKRTGN